jgi:membrane protease YdiL (CAAX protease family)
MRWVAPPGWPTPPPGWAPDPGWRPDPRWPAVPNGWQFWVFESPSHRRLGFRGWLTSLLPSSPMSARSLSRTGPRISVSRCWTEALTVFVLFFGVGVAAAALSEAGQNINPASESVAEDFLDGFSSLAVAVLAVVVVGALSLLRGLKISDLGLAPRWAKRPAYRWQGFGVGLIFAAALITSTVLLGIVTPSAHYPFPATSAWNLIYEIPQAINAGIVEELVVVAFLITALEQARVRAWLIYPIGIALRISYHIYYGPGVVTFVLWAACAIWLFRRTRRITPLIVMHCCYDTLVSLLHELGSPPPAVVGLVFLGLLGVVVLVIVRAIQIGSRGRHNAWPAPPPPMRQAPVFASARPFD